METANNSRSPSSVKDIASRFEKVLKMPHQQPATAGDQGVTNSVKTPESTIVSGKINKFIRTDSQIEFDTKPTISVSNLPLKPALKAWTDFNVTSETIDTKYENNSSTEFSSLPERTAVKPILKQDSPINSLDSATDSASLNGAHRPMQPPDYATAMQRLELIRTSTPDANLLTVDQMQMKPDTPKKKQGPKKTVTFSDEVVLVACAEYDEIDFSSNPLFERVYQQHVESGKGEIPILSGSYNPHGFGRSIQEDVNECNLPPPPPSMFLSSPCNLCHNKEVSSPNSYCTDCEFYLSRYKP